MPLELSDFPEEVQVAFFILSLLPEHYEGTSGTYMGKYWDGIEYYYKLYDVKDPKVILYLMKVYEGKLVAHRHEKAQQQREAEERRRKAAGGGGKNYTHNVKG